MKIDFPLMDTSKRHRYCQNCHSTKVSDINIDGKKYYLCSFCGNSYDRVIDIDPGIVWWIDKKTFEYWHESVGVFVSNDKGELLFFERTIYPYGYTIPAGHLDKDEDPLSAAIRELFEETNLKVDDLEEVISIPIEHDLCRKGADFHLWHVYKCKIPKDQDILISDSEGKEPKWFSIEKALSLELTSPVRYLMETLEERLI